MRTSNAAKLPALPSVSTGNAALDKWVQAVTERLEVREGMRGNPNERAVTVRDMRDAGVSAFTTTSTTPGSVLTVNADGTYSTMTPDAFAESIRSSKLYKDLMKRLDDVTRFDGLPEQVKAVLLTDLAEEAAKRGADIRRLENKLQSTAESLAYTVEEVTAAVEGSVAGVRETVFASASANTATAGKVTQIEARLNDVGGVTIEESMTATADRVDGLAGEYMVKINAGKAAAGFGLAASEDPTGATTSAFIVQADKFAVVTGGDVIADYNNPPANRIPFGVDASGVYINGKLRVNADGDTLEDLATTPGPAGPAGAAGAAGQSISVVATSQVFAIDNSGTVTPSSIICSVMRPPALAGSAVNGDFVWTLVSGSCSQSLTTINSSSGAFGSLSANEITTDSATFRCVYTVSTPGSAYLGMSYTDEITITKVKQGVGVSTFLTNESHTVPASTAGVVSDWTGAGGTFNVYSGTTNVTSSSTFAIVANPSSLTASIGASTGVFSVTGAGSWASASSTTTLTLRATYNHPVTGSASYDKVFTLSKSKAGATGSPGGTGPAGARGSKTVYSTVTSEFQNWPGRTGGKALWCGDGALNETNAAFVDNHATAATCAAVGVPNSTAGLVIGDTVTITRNNTTPARSATGYWGGTAWMNPGVIIDGNLLVSGSVSADKIATSSLTAGTVSTEKIRITAAGSYFPSGPANLSVVDGTATISVPCSLGTPLFSWAASDIAGVAMSLVWYDHNGTAAFFRLNAWHRATGLRWAGTLPVLRIWVY